MRETGYYYYGARYYDPGASIFLSVDPLAEQFPAWNPYHYVHNNPINLVDPKGMSAEDTTGGDGGRLTAWKVFPDNNNKGSYNAYEVASTDWEGDPTDVFSVHNNDGSIDTYNSIKDLNKAGITNVNYQRKNDKSVMGNLQMAYDGWVNPTGETARAKETMLNYIEGVGSFLLPAIGAELIGGNAIKIGAKLTKSELKAISSFESQIAKHQTKLIEYTKNPMKFDNKGFLKNAPNDAVRQKIIQTRIDHLNKEIDVFKNNIEKIINGS